MRAVIATYLAALLLTVGAVARAQGLDASELAQLEAGHTVVRPQTLEQQMYDASRRFIGGIAYTLVDASPEELLSLLDDTTKWPYLLPRTKSATVVAASGLDCWIELSQGAGLVSARNTLYLRKSPSEHMVRFWLDLSRPHAIDDAWGFFRAEPASPNKDGSPRTLLTFAVLVDTGPGIVRTFYEERLRAAMLNVPQVVRRYVLASVRRKSAPT